jgi:hypothetical protein
MHPWLCTQPLSKKSSAKPVRKATGGLRRCGRPTRWHVATAESVSNGIQRIAINSQRVTGERGFAVCVWCPTMHSNTVRPVLLDCRGRREKRWEWQPSSLLTRVCVGV